MTGCPGPTDSWVTLAGIAARPRSIRLGTLVTSATFRHPGPLAISVAQVDAMSAGRVDLGIGAGWFEAEHLAYAIPFPPLGERFERLGEQLDIITGLWTTPAGETFDYARHPLHGQGLTGAAQTGAATAPADHHRRRRAKRTPALAARFAAEFNLAFPTLDFVEPQYGRVRAALQEVGRAARRHRLLGGVRGLRRTRRRRDQPPGAAISREVDELRTNTPLVGTPAEIVDRLAPFIEAGVQRVYLQLLDLSDLDHVELFATEVVRQLA